MTTEGNAKRAVQDSALFRVLVGIVFIYAFLAGLRTLTDYDLPWQLATGRWVAQHHQIPATDVFSYTAHGQPWIYPVGSCLLLYLVFAIGGYALLSWLSAVTCAATVVLLLRRGSLASAMLAILVLPRIAARTGPRADMFTTILFAAFVSVLWGYFSDGRARLWVLPLLMVLWVNLHLGFVVGFALIAAYVGCEVLEMAFPGNGRRRNAVARLRNAWPWLLLTIPATLMNPWGWELYAALLRQNTAMAQHGQWINEWVGVPLNWHVFASQVSLRDTKGVFFLGVIITVGCLLVAVVRRQPGAAILLAGAIYAGMRHVRVQALFACVIIVVGGWSLSAAWAEWSPRVLDVRMRRIVAAGAAALFSILALARSTDLVTNWHYLGGTETATFGTGLSWWFPEQALEFISSQQIPGQLFNHYNLGGFLVWRLSPRYPDYLDSRAIPFGSAIFEKQDRLMSISPDSSEWQNEADRYGINAVVLSLARYDGTVGMLAAFCNSTLWSPVYLDEISAVFVRRPHDAVQGSGTMDCATATVLHEISPISAVAFNQWANASLVLYVLGRQREALAASDRAILIFPDSANLHFIRAKVFSAMRMPRDAEKEYRSALLLEPNDATWASLAQLYQEMGDEPRSIDAMQNAIAISARPHFMLVNLAFLSLGMKNPGAALQAFDEAVRRAPPEATMNRPFQLDLARGRASAWSALGNAQQAIAHEEAATRIAPDRGELWLELATLYELNGQIHEATSARAKARILQASEASRP